MSEEKDDEQSIEDLLKKIIKYGDYEEEGVKNPLHIQTVASTIEQYLSPFIVFGYDVNGDAVVISNGKTQKDDDSLMISIGRYMTQQQIGDMRDDIGDFMDGD
jgi:hypothetical protein